MQRFLAAGPLAGGRQCVDAPAGADAVARAIDVAGYRRAERARMACRRSWNGLGVAGPNAVDRGLPRAVERQRHGRAGYAMPAGSGRLRWASRYSAVDK